MKLNMKLRHLMIMAMLVMVGATVQAADDVAFTASAPQTVVKGDRFRISYKVNTRNIKEFRAPEMKGITVLAGPSQSVSQSTSIINGRASSEVSVTYTLTVVCEEEGEFTIPGATITAEGKSMTSNSLKIKVLPQDKVQSSGSQGQSSGNRQGQASSSASNGNISADDLFMLATVSKSSVYEQEALVLTYKVYVAPSVSLTNLGNKMPDIVNCNVQEVELPQQKEFQLEHYNGRNYRTLLWSQYILYPQKSGEMVIPSLTFESIVSLPMQTNDIFDIFLNGGRSVDVKKDLKTREIKVDVKSLPQGKSNSYYGGVGNFSLSSTISSTEVTANDAVTLKIILSGSGNMKLIRTPEVQFPQDFDIYDPKVENKFTIKNGTQSGNKVFEYLAIPRHSGEYTIPSIDFQYFDPSSGSYKTISSEEYVLKVAKGEGGESQGNVSYVSKEDLKFVGQDVRFHTSGTDLMKTDDLFFGSLGFYLCLIIPFLIFVGLVFVSAGREAGAANVTQNKAKKANKAAVKRLKVARKLMAEGAKDKFYDEIMRAMLGYVGDKLAIPVAELSKETIGNELRERKVSEDIIGVVTHVLDDCEFARYAPGDDTGKMDRLYDEAEKAIGQIESSLK